MPISAGMRSISELLGSSGVLARSLPSYEARPAQLAMAERVALTLKQEQILLCEAGTGTGKTLAYLVPAILSGKKVVVSTATRALQDQIAQQDLPLIEQHLGLAVQATVLKGLGNYLCLRRYREFRNSAQAETSAFRHTLGAIENFRASTQTGELAELSELGESAPIFEAINSSSETRRGAACPYFAECFVTRAKRQAESARLIIVNHYLFFADLALRGPHPARVLPDYDAVIFDEAHRLEAIATDFFGLLSAHSSSRREHRPLLLRRSSNALDAPGRPFLADSKV
jgi:ATP-dependent DNA helicase DinG